MPRFTVKLRQISAGISMYCLVQRGDHFPISVIPIMLALKSSIAYLRVVLSILCMYIADPVSHTKAHARINDNHSRACIAYIVLSLKKKYWYPTVSRSLNHLPT